MDQQVTPLVVTKMRKSSGIIASQHGRKVLHVTDQLGTFAMEGEDLQTFHEGDLVTVTTTGVTTYLEGVKRERSCRYTESRTVALTD